MNVCIFSRTYYPALGGIERMARVLAREFSDAGNNVEVVTDTSSDGRSDVAPVTRTRRPHARYRAFARADVVLSMNMSLHCLPPAWLAQTPIVVSHQSCQSRAGARNSMLGHVKQAAARWVTNIACSRYVAEQLPARAHVIPNAVGHEFLREERAARTRDFVFCGRLVSDKGADIALRAFHRVLQVIPDATLTMIGDGPEMGRLMHLCRELGCARSVRFSGSLEGPDLPAALCGHACMVVPSMWEEPFGIVALEGIACCDTVVVARRGGLPEAVGECGITAEPSVDAFASSMEAIAKARRGGGPLPGQVKAERREAHLRRHAPATIAAQYLTVLQGVARHT
jgi:glycogen(starch) synthase